MTPFSIYARLAAGIVVVLLLTGMWWKFDHTYMRRDEAAAELQKWKDATNKATDIAVAQARQQEADKLTQAKGRIDALQTDLQTIDARARGFAEQLRRARAQGNSTAAVPEVATAGQGLRPASLPIVSRPSDSLDLAVVDRLTKAEKLRISCVKLWDQAEDDRR